MGYTSIPNLARPGPPPQRGRSVQAEPQAGGGHEHAMVSCRPSTSPLWCHLCFLCWRGCQCSPALALRGLFALVGCVGTSRRDLLYCSPRPPPRFSCCSDCPCRPLGCLPQRVPLFSLSGKPLGFSRSRLRHSSAHLSFPGDPSYIWWRWGCGWGSSNCMVQGQDV